MTKEKYYKENPAVKQAEDYVSTLIDMKELMVKQREGNSHQIFMDMLSVFNVEITVHGKEYTSYITKYDNPDKIVIDFD